MARRARTLQSLPASPNPLIGREHELQSVLQLLDSTGVRLVTVTGPAGAGKTRLAVSAASQYRHRAVDGVWFVDLAPIDEPRQVLTAIGRATGVHEHRGALAPERIQRHIGQRRVLLLLDNFEQVLAAATGLADLLATCSNLKILATSRAALRLRWEHVFQLAPLALPDSAQLPPPEQLAQIPAIALFLERAQAVDPSFRINQINARPVTDICVGLDGLPLAIELAAARSDVYTPDEILRRLQHQFDLLVRGAADLPARQQSLEAAFDWGYELLGEGDRALFRALGVFVGGFTLEAGLSVAGSDDFTKLVQHSLVRRDQALEDGRFRMLETVRGYALERLERSGERQAVLARHARFMLELAERAAPELLGGRQALWLERLEREHDNLGAALRWTIATGEVESGLRLARALWRFWWLHGDLSEGMDLVDAVLAASDDVAPELRPVRAAVLNGGGVLAHVRGEYERAASLLTQSLQLSRSLGLKSGMAAALHNLGALWRDRGDWRQAKAAYAQSLSIERETGNGWGIAISLINLGALAADQSDTKAASALLGESLPLLRDIGDTRGIAAALHNLASVARDLGDWHRAAELNEESLALWRKLGDRWGTASALTELARVSELSGDWRRAAHLYGDSLVIFGDLGIRQAIAPCLEGLAAVLCDARRGADAARLLGAAEALREELGASLPIRDRQALARVVAQARAATSSSSFRSAWQAGRDLAAEEVASEALRLVASLSADTDATSAHQTGASDLTLRERQVAELIANGLSNRQIAARLVISERTADRHVSNILGKLGLDRRAQVAAWAAARR
jgi:predicted ATPase/DNA-binding NarL/FixJ family response regulator